MDHKLIEALAEDAWQTYIELTACGFSDDQALKLIPTVMYAAERRVNL
ncbi:hypothetical protein ACTMTF_15415 [Nonomuraea sp. ZG12]